MLHINNILRIYSNDAISKISGYPVEQIYMLRKNEVDYQIIKNDANNRPVPVRSVMVNIIENRFDDYIKNKNKIY